MGNPTYVERGGEQVFVPPFIAEGVQFFGFCVQADRGALQDVCNRYLNGPSGSQNFVPALSYVMFVFNKLDKLFAKQSPWRERGVYKEQEAAVWMLVLDRERHRLFWFHPYIIVDSAYAMAMGREVYGFPKCLGQFSVPDGPRTPASMYVQTTVVRKFGVDQPAELGRLIEAEAAGAATGEPIIFASIELLANGVVDQLAANERTSSELADSVIRRGLLSLKIPMVFLKQFRDGSDTTGACFQAIETAVTEMKGFYGACVYRQAYAINLGDFESHPIRKDLGLASGPVPVAVAFWAKFDFEIGRVFP